MKIRKSNPSSPRFFESDMAKERCPKEASGCGVFHAEERSTHYALTRVCITTREAAERVGRPEGQYVTLTFSDPTLLSHDGQSALEERLITLLRETVPEKVRRLLVVGLGNRRLTVDSIGPKTADAVTATAALSGTSAEALLRDAKLISVFCPDVFGETGMETADLVRSAVSITRADAIVAIDAMATADPRHLLRAVELSNTGTVPGAGIGNRRAPLSAETMGVPVTALGVPTMMRARPYLRRALVDFGVENGQAENYAKREDSLLVVPHGLDEGTSAVSRLLSRAINAAFGFEAEA